MQSDSISSTGLTSSSVDSALPTGATWSTCAPMAWKYSVEERAPLVVPLVVPFVCGGSIDILIMDLGVVWRVSWEVVARCSYDGDVVSFVQNFGGAKWRGSRLMSLHPAWSGRFSSACDCQQGSSAGNIQALFRMNSLDESYAGWITSASQFFFYYIFLS